MFICRPTISNSTTQYNSDDGIYISSGSPVISNNTLSNNTRYGVYVYDGSPEVDDNTITGNGTYGILLDAGATYVPFSGNTVTGNGTNGIVFQGTVYSDYTWGHDLPMVITGNLYVNDDITLTLPAGTVVKGATAGQLYGGAPRCGC